MKVSKRGGGGISKTTVWFIVMVDVFPEGEAALAAAGEEEEAGLVTTGLSSFNTLFTSTGDCTLICS